MQMTIPTMAKLLVVTIFAMATFITAQQTARADEVTFTGNTNGCFNCAVPPIGPALQSDTLLGLTFVNSTFNNTTVGGMLGFGGNPTFPGQNLDNFGSFNLTNTANMYNGNTFTLRVTFTAPPGITGGQSQLYTATVMGAVLANGNGGVLIDFGQAINNGMMFTFASGTTIGSFTLRISDVSINPGQTASVDAFIISATQTNVPEPASLLLLGTGMLGLGAGLRRSRRSRRAQHIFTKE
jgi:hypothetical protein